MTDGSLNAVKAYITQILRGGPAHGLLASVPVGTAPDGIILIKNGAVVTVANSNRFSRKPGSETLSLLGAAPALARHPDLLGTLTVGAFPPEPAQSAEGGTLFVTNFDSNSVTARDVPKLPAPR